MTTGDRSRLVLALGWWVSVFLHAGFGFGFVRYVSEVGIQAPDAESSPAVPDPPPRLEPEPKRIKLGIAESTADTMVWIGFEEATPHDARLSTLDQSAVTINDAGRPAPPSPAPAAAQAQPLPRRDAGDAEAAIEALAAARGRVEDAVPPELRAQAAATPAAGPPRPTEAAESGGGGLPGIKTDREAQAVSSRPSNSVKPGQVVAAQGLEIKTIAPRWNTVTLFTGMRNPTLRISFRRDGSVKDAVFVRDGDKVLDAGSSEANQPLLAAVYAWRAKGKALDELDPEDPDADVTIQMTIILRG